MVKVYWGGDFCQELMEEILYNNTSNRVLKRLDPNSTILEGSLGGVLLFLYTEPVPFAEPSL